MRKQVLQSYKSLRKAGKMVFDGDLFALEKVRLKINEEFKRNRNIEDTNKIVELVKLAKEVETELRTKVIQAVEIGPGKYEAKIRSDTVKLDNVPFKDMCSTKLEKT